MGDWSYLSSLLDKVQSHSTVVGKIWMSVLFLFRIFVLGAAADKVWGDEVSEFYCDSLEPGCDHACYNWKFPISFVHYWVLQIIFVSTPTLVYLGHAVHVIHREKRMLEQMNDGRLFRKPKYTDDRGKVRLRGVLFCTYVTQLVFTILLEVGFCVGQYFIFGSVFVDPFFHCSTSPCADISGAQCSVSRPTEKSIFIVFMLVVSGISVVLNIVEIVYLLCNRRREANKKSRGQQYSKNWQQYPLNRAWNGNSFPMESLETQQPPQFDSIIKEKDT
ncbi:unnamed protein product [Ophioblennius macclurei]